MHQLIFVPSIIEEQILFFFFVPLIVEEQILWFVFIPSIVQEPINLFFFVPSIDVTYRRCAAKAFYSCPAIISRRPGSQNTSKESQLNSVLSSTPRYGTVPVTVPASLPCQRLHEDAPQDAAQGPPARGGQTGRAGEAQYAGGHHPGEHPLTSDVNQPEDWDFDRRRWRKWS